LLTQRWQNTAGLPCGVFILSLWIIFNIYVFMKSRVTIETRQLSVLIIAVLLTNLVAANLTAITT